jgi:predicted nucleic acid-binding protein
MAMTAVDPVFVDTNILVYAKQALSPFHALAVAKLQQLTTAGHPLWISRQILREYLVAMSKPTGLTATVPLVDLIRDTTAFERQFHVAEDGPRVTVQLLSLLATTPCIGNQIHDTNIVATMLAHGIRAILTHNVTDFNRFAPQITIIPLVP